LPPKGPDQTRARELAIEFFKRWPDKPILVGPVALWIAHGYSLKETEQLLDELVLEGVLRYASNEEGGEYASRLERGWRKAYIWAKP
jgi:hypothetical protein